jgi:hypothetical protein
MKIFKAPTLAGIDGDAVLHEARSLIATPLDQPSRRAFLQRSLTLGGLSLLTGCSISDNTQVEAALTKISRLNDKVQGLIFSPTQLAPTYTEAEITRPFPVQRLLRRGRGARGRRGRLQARSDRHGRRQRTPGPCPSCAPCRSTTRSRGTSAWKAGAPSASGAACASPTSCATSAPTLSAKYVGFKCADDYYTSIDMPTALHPQTLLTLTYDGQPLPPKYGFPMKLRMPTKLGYKNPKHIKAMFVTNTYTGGYWEDQGYNWFGGS